MNYVDQIITDYCKALNEQCLESMELDSVDSEEKHFKRHVIYEGYMNLEKLGIDPSANKVKIVYNPEYCALNIGVYVSNQLKYYLPIVLDINDWRKVEDKK